MTRSVFKIDHRTRYRYSNPAAQCVMLLCLQPRQDRGQHLLDFTLSTQPRSRLTPDTDCFGNQRHVLYLHEPHDALDIQARSVVTSAPDPVLPDSLAEDAWERLPASLVPFNDWDHLQPSALTRPSSSLIEFVSGNGIERGPDPLRSVLVLSRTLHRTLKYVPGSTSAHSTIEQVLATGAGVCQDYAHLLIAITRSWGIPSRYVSGFLCPSDATPTLHTTHAWVECRFPELGWVGFDPTNDSLAGACHIRIATGRDFSDVSPTSGILKDGGKATLDVDVEIRPCAEPDCRSDHAAQSSAMP